MMRYLITKTLIKIIFLWGVALTAAGQQVDYDEIPCTMNHYRFFFELPTEKGDTLTFITDTGGGFDILWASAQEEFEFPTYNEEIRGREIKSVSWDALGFEDSAISEDLLEGGLIVYPAPPHMPESDGFIGGSFFINHAWYFDYENGVLGAVDENHQSEYSSANRVLMFLDRDAEGNVAGIHSALDVVIDGDTARMLFDTGATLLPTDAGREVISPQGLSSYSASYMSEKRMDELHAKHPDWRYVNAGDMGGKSNLLEVPAVKIGDQTTGKVWFASRPKSNFVEINGENLDGAIGGSTLRYFKVLADYKNGYFDFALIED